MFLLFNMLSRLVIAFLPRSKCLLISWLQSRPAVILENKRIKSDTVSLFPPSIYPEVMGPDAMVLAFWMLSFQPAFSLSSFMLIKRLFNSSLLSAIRVKPDVVDISEHVLIFFLAILIPTCNSSSPAFPMMHSEYRLNNQSDNTQPWSIPFPILNQSIVPCLVLAVVSWSAYRFYSRRVRWSGIPISLRIFQFVVIHIVKDFNIISEADVFPEFPCLDSLWPLAL